MATDPTVILSAGKQYLRKMTLLVSDKAGNALDLSQFRVKFSVKRTNSQTVNTADIKVYNISQSAALQIQKQYTKVILQAGYDSNYGVIFAGNVIQTIIGRESGTDTFLQILAGDGDLAYNFAIINQSLAKPTAQDQINQCADAMAKMGTTKGGNSTIQSGTKLYRGKTLYGNARHYLQGVASTNNQVFSIQDEKIVFVPENGYLPSVAVVINETTGMVGSPQETLEGVNVKCLLNPFIQIATRVRLNNAEVQRKALDITIPGSSKELTVGLTADGLYFVLGVDHTGDSRGNDWYSSLVMIATDPSTGIPAAQGISF